MEKQREVDWIDREEAGGREPGEILRKHSAGKMVMMLTERETLGRSFCRADGELDLRLAEFK